VGQAFQPAGSLERLSHIGFARRKALRGTEREKSVPLSTTALHDKDAPVGSQSDGQWHGSAG